jgi:myo-inositol-1(or 4)-monophosphatase
MRYKISTREMTFAINFALKAGKLARENFGFHTNTEWKGDETPVTKTDLTINTNFIQAIKKEFPGANILGEETGFMDNGSQITWVIDPIDGTGPFSQGIPLFTSCISMLEDGVPVLGIMYDPILDRLFYGQKGHGAFMNDTPIAASQATTLDRQFVHIDSLKTGNRWLLPLRQLLLEQGCTPLALNATQYGASLVCAGKLVGTVYSASCAWDAAAAYAIGTEAGCIVTDLYGNDQRYDQDTQGFIIASNADIHKRLVQLVAQCKEIEKENTK